MLYHNVRVAAHSMRTIDSLAGALAAGAAWQLGMRAGYWSTDSAQAMTVYVCSYLIAFVLVGGRLRIYHARRTEEVALELAVLCEVGLYAAGAACLVTQVLSQGLPGAVYGAAVASSLLTVLGLRAILRWVIRGIRRMGGDERVWLIVGHNRRAAALCSDILASPHYGIRIEQIIDVADPATLAGRSAESDAEREGFMTQVAPGIPLQRISDVEELRQIIASRIIDEIVVTLPVRSHYNVISQILAVCSGAGVSVKLRPEVFETDGYLTEVSYVGSTAMVTHFSGPSNYSHLLIKRLIDVFGAAAGIVLLMPVFLAIAIAVKFGSPGPILFRQTRVGLHGRQFAMVKFRSMVQEALQLRAGLALLNERDGVAFKIRHDSRITPTGRFLRKYHLDELPQLWNVLSGDMSIVGPRPLPVAEAQGNEWWQRRRLSMPPGLTCLWQLADDPTMPFLDWMRLDMKYIDTWSLSLDLKLMLRTVSTVMRGTGW